MLLKSKDFRDLAKSARLAGLARLIWIAPKNDEFNWSFLFRDITRFGEC